MSPLLLTGLVVVGLGSAVIIVGVVMNIFDWQSDRARRRQEQVSVDAQAAEKTINALTKLVTALKGAREGTQLIVFGIVIIVVGAPFLGIGSL